jgi:hypothetical protein
VKIVGTWSRVSARVPFPAAGRHSQTGKPSQLHEKSSAIQ